MDCFDVRALSAACGSPHIRRLGFDEWQSDYTVKDGQLGLDDPDTNEVTQHDYAVVGDIFTVEREDGPNTAFVRKK